MGPIVGGPNETGGRVRLLQGAGVRAKAYLRVWPDGENV